MQEMSQKNQEKIKKIDYLYPITEKLDILFNPSQFGIFYPEDREIGNTVDEVKRKKEDELYQEIIKGLESDMTKLGMDLTYSSKIIMRELAMNLVLLGRVKIEFVCRGLLRDKKILKPDYISSKRDLAYPSNTSKSISYDVLHIHGEEEIHPLFDRLIPKLQKQVNDGLKALALLPVQQIERQKITIIKKLRQRYENLSGEVSVEAKTEKTFI